MFSLVWTVEWVIIKSERERCSGEIYKNRKQIFYTGSLRLKFFVQHMRKLVHFYWDGFPRWISKRKKDFGRGLFKKKLSWFSVVSFWKCYEIFMILLVILLVPSTNSWSISKLNWGFLNKPETLFKLWWVSFYTSLIKNLFYKFMDQNSPQSKKLFYF